MLRTSFSYFYWEHAIVLVGYDDSKGVWIIRNSWGVGWRDHGYCEIPYFGHNHSDLRYHVVKNVMR